MQFVRVTSTAAVLLLFGTMVPVYAQHEQQNEKQGRPESRQGGQPQGASRPAQRSGLSRLATTTQQQQRAQQTQQQQHAAAAARPADSAAATAAAAAGRSRSRPQPQQQQPQQQQRAQQQPSNGRNSSRHNVPSRPSNNSSRSVPSSRQWRGNSSGDGNSMAPGRGIAHFSRTARNTGTPIIALGRSVEAMAVTTFLRTASVSISGVNTGSGCPAPRCTWGILVSRTAAFRSCWWIPGRNTGRKTGTRPMTFTSVMTMGTTFTTAGIRALDWQSRSRCNRRTHGTAPHRTRRLAARGGIGRERRDPFDGESGAGRRGRACDSQQRNGRGGRRPGRRGDVDGRGRIRVRALPGGHRTGRPRAGTRGTEDGRRGRAPGTDGDLCRSRARSRARQTGRRATDGA